ncbi:hypothetical protein J1N35_036926, partial [Gossypium stocksii]
LTLLLNTKEGRPMLPKQKTQSKYHLQHDTGKQKTQSRYHLQRDTGKQKTQSKYHLQHDTGNSSAGEDDVPCCPATTKKGGGGFMNMLCKALGCCGLLSACYDPRTPH